MSKKIYIVSSKYRNKLHNENGDVVLTEKDFDPMKPFFREHSSLIQESVDEIYTFGLLETYKYTRYVYKVIDYLLKNEGCLKISYYDGGLDTSFYVYPLNWITSELALVFKERILLEKKDKNGQSIDFYYKKCSSTSANDNDSIDKWTFAIVSDGRKNDRVLSIINRVNNMGIPEFEFLVCGPAPSDNLPDFVRIVDDSDLYTDIRIPISKKKNKIVSCAKYENLVIIHDRIMPPADFYERMKEYGNCFDCIVPSIVDENDKRLHVLDNVHGVLDDKLRCFKWRKSKPYWSSQLYVDGSTIIIKKHIMQQVPIPPYLNWADREDLIFSRILYDNGFLISFNYDLQFTTLTYMKKGRSKEEKYYNLIIFQGWLRRFYSGKRQFNKYLESL